MSISEQSSFSRWPSKSLSSCLAVTLNKPISSSVRHNPRSATLQRALVDGLAPMVPSTTRISRGEAMECAASLDVLKLRKLVDRPKYDRGIELLEGVVSMLTKML